MVLVMRLDFERKKKFKFSNFGKDFSVRLFAHCNQTIFKCEILYISEPRTDLTPRLIAEDLSISVPILVLPCENNFSFQILPRLFV